MLRLRLQNPILSSKLKYYVATLFPDQNKITRFKHIVVQAFYLGNSVSKLGTLRTL